MVDNRAKKRSNLNCGHAGSALEECIILFLICIYYQLSKKYLHNMFMFPISIVSFYIKVNVITISTYTIKELIRKTINEPSLKKQQQIKTIKNCISYNFSPLKF